MKKQFKIVAIVAGCLVLGIGCFVGWFKYQMRDMRLIDNKKLNDSLYVLKGDVSNMYLLKSGDGFVAFDASDNPEKLLSGCAALSIDPLSVKTVFLTHTDRDHVNGLTAFSKAAVYIPNDDELLLKSKNHRHFLGLPHKNTLPVADYKKIDDGDSIQLPGMVVHAIGTPGHTRGSTCYRVGELLFTGDLLMLVRGTVEPMMKIFTEDMSVDSLSIRKVAGMNNIRHLYTAHAGVSDDVAGAFGKWR